nr:MAG TPA: hypothetical protein [Crassvirales sp.]
MPLNNFPPSLLHITSLFQSKFPLLPKIDFRLPLKIISFVILFIPPVPSETLLISIISAGDWFTI